MEEEEIGGGMKVIGGRRRRERDDFSPDGEADEWVGSVDRNGQGCKPNRKLGHVTTNHVLS